MSELDKEDMAIRPMLATAGVPTEWWPLAPISERQAMILMLEWHLVSTGEWLGSPLSPGPSTAPGTGAPSKSE